MGRTIRVVPARHPTADDLDLLVHAWDLAQAMGQPFDPPTDFVEASYGFFNVAVNDDLRAAGMFGPSIEVAADASALTRLLAHSGRRA